MEQMRNNVLELIDITRLWLREALESYKSVEQILTEDHSIATAARTVYAIENDILIHT